MGTSIKAHLEIKTEDKWTYATEVELHINARNYVSYILMGCKKETPHLPWPKDIDPASKLIMHWIDADPGGYFDHEMSITDEDLIFALTGAKESFFEEEVASRGDCDDTYAEYLGVELFQEDTLEKLASPGYGLITGITDYRILIETF